MRILLFTKDIDESYSFHSSKIPTRTHELYQCLGQLIYVDDVISFIQIKLSVFSQMPAVEKFLNGFSVALNERVIASASICECY